MVKGRYIVGRGFTRCSACRRKDRFALCNAPFVSRLPNEPFFERCYEQAGLDRVQIRRIRSIQPVEGAHCAKGWLGLSLEGASAAEFANPCKLRPRPSSRQRKHRINIKTL